MQIITVIEVLHGEIFGTPEIVARGSAECARFAAIHDRGSVCPQVWTHDEGDGVTCVVTWVDLA